MRIVVEVTELMSNAEVVSELRSLASDMGLAYLYSGMGSLDVRVVGTVSEITEANGYDGQPVWRVTPMEEL